MSYCGITDVGAIEMAHALPFGPESLTMVDLRFNEIVKDKTNIALKERDRGSHAVAAHREQSHATR